MAMKGDWDTGQSGDCDRRMCRVLWEPRGGRGWVGREAREASRKTGLQAEPGGKRRFPTVDTWKDRAVGEHFTEHLGMDKREA